MSESTADAWERHAAEWIAWTEPEHEDGFWTATWPTLRRMLPSSAGPVLDLGCGEGRGLRELAALGYEVVGVDRSPTLARAAHERGSFVVVADAARLPLPDASLSLVFASMSLLDIDDLDATLAEVHRVLMPGGHLVAAIVHPFISALDLEVLDAGTLRLPAPYLSPRPYKDEVTRNGRSMTFHSIHRPLRHYLGGLFRLGFLVSELQEEGDGDIPWLLAFRADKAAG